MANRVEELENLDIMSNKSIAQSAKVIRNLGRDLQSCLEMMAEELKAVLMTIPSDGSGPAVLRARKVSKHLENAAKDAHSMGLNGAKMWIEFQKVYEPELSKVKGKPAKPAFKWEKQ